MIDFNEGNIAVGLIQDVEGFCSCDDWRSLEYSLCIYACVYVCFCFDCGAFSFSSACVNLLQ